MQAEQWLDMAGPFFHKANMDRSSTFLKRNSGRLETSSEPQAQTKLKLRAVWDM